MTPRFILDENVVILAQRGTDDHHNPSSICSDLVQNIIQICHTLVVDDVLWSYYEDQLYNQAYQDADLGPQIMFALWDARTTDGKVDGIGRTAPSFPEEGAIPCGSQDDTYLVRIAVETGAILVTTDTPLRDDLAQSDYGLTGHVTRRGLGLRTQGRIGTPQLPPHAPNLIPSARCWIPSGEDPKGL